MQRSIVLVQMVCDGDCGIDVMCEIIGVQSTEQSRFDLRQELSRFLIDEAEQPWMSELLRVRQELPDETVEEVGVAYKAEGDFRIGLVGGSGKEIEAMEGRTKLAMQALEDCLGRKDQSVIRGVLAKAPLALIEELVANFKVRERTALAVKQRDSMERLQ